MAVSNKRVVIVTINIYWVVYLRWQLLWCEPFEIFEVKNNMSTILSLNHEYTSDCISFKRDLRVNSSFSNFVKNIFWKISVIKRIPRVVLKNWTRYFTRSFGFSIGPSYTTLLILRRLSKSQSVLSTFWHITVYFRISPSQFSSQFLQSFK